MSTVTDPTNIPDLPELKTVVERLRDEHEKWLKAKRSGDRSRQMRDARERMDSLLDELLLLQKVESPII